jgi:hypothetical protein
LKSRGWKRYRVEVFTEKINVFETLARSEKGAKKHFDNGLLVDETLIREHVIKITELGFGEVKT